MERVWRKTLLMGLAAAGFFAAAVPKVSSDPLHAAGPLASVARSCATPEQVARFLRDHVIFQEDMHLFGKADYWQAPEEFLARGRGDCEDYALLARALLSRQGVRAFVFSLYGESGYAHTVCVFMEGERYSVLNQDRLLHYRAASLEELAGKLYRAWEWGAVAERHGHRGRAVRIIRRSGLSNN